MENFMSSGLSIGVDIKSSSTDSLGDDLLIEEATPLSNIFILAQGTFGRIYAVKHSETICAAKEFRTTGGALTRQTVEQILRSCSKLRHPNVIQFLGVFHNDTTDGLRLPVMVMEMMVDSLTSFLKEHQKIPTNLKFSIIHDVSLGLCYFHNRDPPIIHGELFPRKVLLTAQCVAKISLGVTSKLRMLVGERRMATVTPANFAFLPPETFKSCYNCRTSTDIFSFAGIVLYTFNQQWPTPSTIKTRFDFHTSETIVLSEREKRQEHLEKMGEEFKALRLLVEKCLDNDPAARPKMAAVCRSITDCKKESHYAKDVTTIQLHEQFEHMIVSARELKAENEFLVHEIVQLRMRQLHSTNPKPKLPSVSVLTKRMIRKLPTVEAPPLLPALLSGRYNIKWTQLADLPAPMFAAYVAVQGNKIYLCGGHSPIEEAEHHVYMYDLTTNQWGQLPSPGCYYGVPHIIGGKLVIIGGNMSATREITNKVSTLDGLTWASYYPNLLSVRSRPGVITHKEYVIVAGGRNSLIIPMAQNDVEILDWTENTQWRRVLINLPVPMWDFTPFIFEDHFFIVGYSNSVGDRYNNVFKIPVKNITVSENQQTQSNNANSKWIKLASRPNWAMAIVTGLSPPVVVGGCKHPNKPVADIEVYDSSTDSWENIGALSLARSFPVVAIVHDSIIVVGGCVLCDTMVNAKYTSLTLMEMGQAELPKIKKCSIIDY